MVLPADTNEPDSAAITPIFSSSSARAVLAANPAAATARAAPSETYFIRAFLPASVSSVTRIRPLIRSAYCRMTLESTRRSPFGGRRTLVERSARRAPDHEGKGRSRRAADESRSFKIQGDDLSGWKSKASPTLLNLLPSFCRPPTIPTPRVAISGSFSSKVAWRDVAGTGGRRRSPCCPRRLPKRRA